METKPALYCTEFWMHIALQLFLILNTAHVWTYMSPKWSGIAQAAIYIGYALSRGIAKSKGGFDPNNHNNFTLIPRRSLFNKSR